MQQNLSIANPKSVAYVGALRSQGAEAADMWFTPKRIIDAAHKALCGIDLDPFSCPEANEGVMARRIITKEQNAFLKTWKADSVFMNPPYSRGLCGRACGKFVDEYNRRHFERGMVLINNMTDTEWFHNLVAPASAVCLVKGRIQFLAKDNKRVSGNTRGQILVMFARQKKHTALFKAAMKDIGRVFNGGA